MKIDAVFYNQLKSVQGISKIYPVTAPEKTQAPYIVYYTTNTNRVKDLESGYDGLIEATYEVNIIDKSYKNLIETKDNIVSKLKSMQQVDLGLYVSETSITNEEVMFESKTKLYYMVIEIIIYYKEGI